MRPLIGLSLLAAALAIWVWLRLPFAAERFADLYGGADAQASPEPARDPGSDAVPPPREEPVFDLLADMPGGEFAEPRLPTFGGPPKLVAPRLPVRVCEFAPGERSAPEQSVRRAAQTADLTSPVAASFAPSGAEEAREPSPFARAKRAYELLLEGHRRAAAAEFDAALAAEPSHPAAASWRAQLAVLNRRFRVNGFALHRPGPSPADPASLPGLGGSQQAVAARFTPDPLAARPVFGSLRYTRSPGATGSQEIAPGIGWQPLGPNGPDLVAERRLALSGGENLWQFRLSGGLTAEDPTGLTLSAYADAGMAGLSDPILFAGGHGFAGYRVLPNLIAGGGLWSGWQDGDGRQPFVEAGPQLRARLSLGSATLSAFASYRLRVAGDSNPASGPVLTLGATY
ncbi:hypothetical protein B5C34_05130 [Pacificimonas flava]|uniref:Bacteriophage N4 adsorption protein A C-terminal domain-containing protein n=2 Tax=Pacificimonas TaxID=1960290 RepID=A0A219B3Y6_9SPHN|nr:MULTISPECIES: hypothetical protein [Pacificimonas]MBZ6377399.1 hypothetical protein [Pacificimonas aurantium]OWV32894.1 hypothetical protein B5C34_05130 [Pacificimonas flava]